MKNVVRNSAGRISYLHYFGAGAGAVRFRESSPFAEPGDDLDKTQPSYHVLVGAEVPIAGWLAVAVDGRYRYIPGLLGEEGASAVFDDDSLGGFQRPSGLRVGLRRPEAARASASPTPAPRSMRQAPPPSGASPTGVITAAAPVFLLPDATRTPLRTLPAGTAVKILEEKGNWIRVEFRTGSTEPGWATWSVVSFSCLGNSSEAARQDP